MISGKGSKAHALLDLFQLFPLDLSRPAGSVMLPDDLSHRLNRFPNLGRTPLLAALQDLPPAAVRRPNAKNHASLSAAAFRFLAALLSC